MLVYVVKYTRIHPVRLCIFIDVRRVSYTLDFFAIGGQLCILWGNMGSIYEEIFSLIDEGEYLCIMII